MVLLTDAVCIRPKPMKTMRMIESHRNFGEAEENQADAEHSGGDLHHAGEAADSFAHGKRDARSECADSGSGGEPAKGVRAAVENLRGEHGEENGVRVTHQADRREGEQDGAHGEEKCGRNSSLREFVRGCWWWSVLRR